jgi:hypothetical protein
VHAESKEQRVEKIESSGQRAENREQTAERVYVPF